MDTSPRAALIQHLLDHAVRTDGPFTLRSGEVAAWYIDARQTTFDGHGAAIVGAAVAAELPTEVTAVGGLTMGADPIALATAMAADPPLRAFSIRKEAKDHGTGGRLVGPVGPGDVVAVLEDTTTTGGAIVEAVDVLGAEGITVACVIALVDRSRGRVTELLSARRIPYTAVVTPSDLGVT